MPNIVDEWRKELCEASRDDPTVYRCFRMADHNGMSGEDRYVALAIHLLREKQRLHEMLMREINLRPSIMEIEVPRKEN